MMPRILKIKPFCIGGALIVALSGNSGVSYAQIFNGSATLQGGNYVLTDGKPFEAGSFFVGNRISTTSFVVTFDFIFQDPDADGIAFVVQGNGPDALGSPGGGVGYGNPPGQTGACITNSLAIVFDLHNNQGEGDNSVRLEYNGVTMGGGAIDMTPSGINLHTPGHHYYGAVEYFAGALDVYMTDLDAQIQLMQISMRLGPESSIFLKLSAVRRPISASPEVPGFTPQSNRSSTSTLPPLA